MALDELDERGRGHHESIDGLERGGGRRSWPAVDRRQLPDEVAGFLDGQEDLAARSRLDRHLDLTVEDGDDVVAGLTLAEEALARPEAPGAAGGLEGAPLVPGQETVRPSAPYHGPSVRTALRTGRTRVRPARHADQHVRGGRRPGAQPWRTGCQRRGTGAAVL